MKEVWKHKCTQVNDKAATLLDNATTNKPFSRKGQNEVKQGHIDQTGADAH